MTNVRMCSGYQDVEPFSQDHNNAVLTKLRQQKTESLDLMDKELKNVKYRIIALSHTECGPSEDLQFKLLYAEEAKLKTRRKLYEERWDSKINMVSRMLQK
jgi:hypothetical protein